MWRIGYLKGYLWGLSVILCVDVRAFGLLMYMQL